MREKDDLNKGKDDWMSYQKRRDQSETDRLADQENNDKIAAKKLDRIEAEKKAADAGKDKTKEKAKRIGRATNPEGGFQLG